MTISRWILFRRSVSNKRSRQNRNTHFMFTNSFFLLFENRAVYEISKNVVDPERPQITVWRLVACWISNATRAQAHIQKYKVVQIWPVQTVTCLHTDRPGHIWTTLYVIFIAFPQQQWCHERASVLGYTYIACLVWSCDIVGSWGHANGGGSGTSSCLCQWNVDK
jgi:hypothetical protein